MADIESSIKELSIRCPSCRQRFFVSQDLKGRTVECGFCNTRFAINNEVITRTKRFYPGERNSETEGAFQRVPLASGKMETLKTVTYQDFKNIEIIQPASPARVLSGGFGILAMIVVALAFSLSTSPTTFLGAMTMTNRLVFAGFIAILGFVLIIFANQRKRKQAVLIGLALSSGLMSLPYVFKPKEIVVAAPPPSIFEEMSANDALANSSSAPIGDLRTRYVTKPLEAEQKLFETANNGKKAYGIFLTGLNQRNLFVVRDFLIRETFADLSSHPYPRDGGNYLMVLSSVKLPFEEVAKVASRLGKINELHAEIGVIDITVDNVLFDFTDVAALNDSSDINFYKLNQAELKSIDVDRVKKAVDRFTLAEPKIFRTDITRELVDLMGRPGIRFHDSIAKALLIWAENPTQAAEAALEILKQDLAAGDNASENLVSLIAKGKIASAIPTFHSLWLAAPNAYENSYVEFGASIEDEVNKQLSSDNSVLRHSAIKILDRIGTRKSLSALGALSVFDDPETRLLAESAIKNIQSR